MQCSRTISFAQATYNECLRTTDCNLVCSLEQESHTAPFMLSIHSPDNVFMVLVSIFISNHNHFCVLCFHLAAALHHFMTYWNIEHNLLKMYGRTVVQRRLYVSALRCRDKNYLTDLPFGWPIVPMQRDLVNQELHLPIITLKMPWGRIPATIDSRAHQLRKS